MEDVKRRTKGRKKERKEREARGGLHSSSGGFYEKKGAKLVERRGSLRGRGGRTTPFVRKRGES